MYFFFPLWANELAQIPLSTAAVLSARYAWIVPPAWYSEPGTKLDGDMKTQVADGGYFENSGVATALDIIRGMKSVTALRGKVDIRLIILTRGDYANESSLGAEELSAPIRALLSTRGVGDIPQSGRLSENCMLNLRERMFTRCSGSTCAIWAMDFRLAGGYQS